MKKTTLSLIFFLFLSKVFAQTPGAGSLAFIGFQNNAPDGFAIVLLQDFPGNQEVYFTDNGWSGSALFENEQTLVWTLPEQGLTAGTTVQFRNLDDVNTFITPSNAGTTVGSLSSLSAAGEQILAYVGSTANPSFIAGISSTEWIDQCNTTGIGNTNSTCLPAPLINGLNAFAFTNTSEVFANGFFNLASFNGTPQDLLALIMNVNNWVLDASTNIAGFNQWPQWNFNFGGASSSTIQFVNTNATINTNASPFDINLNILPGAITAGNVTISYSLSNGITNSDFSINQTVSNNSFVLPLILAQIDAIFTVTLTPGFTLTTPQTITFNISNTSDLSQLQIGANSDFVLTINPAAVGETPVLFINELMAQNSMTIADENGEYDDWIEIYNPNNFEVDIAGFYITDNYNLLTKYEFPFGSDLTKIPANGFKLIWADNQPEQGPLHTNFGLSMNGEVVALVAPNGTAIIDSISFGAQTLDISFGRQNDGQTPWVTFANPTPGESNNSTSLTMLSKNNLMHIYPNPAQQHVYMLWSGDFQNNVAFQIFDMNGKMIYQQNQINLYSNTAIQLPIENLDNGIYHLVLSNDSIKQKARIVISR